MNTLELKELKDELSKLTYEEKRERNEYLKQIAKGEISGSTTGYASVDKPWFKFYNNVNIDLPSHISIYEFTKKQNEKRSNMIAINYFGNLITYNELFTKIENVAMKFSEMGVKCGDIVTICMPTTPEVAICFYALNKLGAVCDMIDPRSNKDQLDYYLKENGSRMLIVCANYFKVLEDTIEKHVKEGNLDYVINLPITPSAPLSLKLLVDYKVRKKNKGAKKINKVISWDDFLKIKGNIFYKEMIHPRDDALIVHSSGTTSVPKGIVLSNRNVNSIAIQYKNTSLKTDPGSKFLSVIPAFASFGMITSINLPFYLGMENILMPLVNDELFIKAFKKNKINFCLTVPGKFMALARSKKKVDLTGLYGPGAGGYSLDSTKEEEINNYLKKNKSPSPMLMGWGMSELASTACLELPECAKTLSSGIPLPMNTIAIFKPGTDIELPIGEEGEMCVSGPSIMQRYLNNPEKTLSVKKIHSDGTLWLHSGDIGYMDKDGRVYHVDRCERMIIKGIDGFKMFPQKIENVIGSSRCVRECVVVGKNTHEKGMVAKAWISLEDQYKEKISEAYGDILFKCSETLSERQIPDLFEIIDEIPYTMLGKPDYKSLETKEAKNEVKFESIKKSKEKIYTKKR